MAWRSSQAQVPLPALVKFQALTSPGSGIGRAVALAYAAEGARGVVVVDLNHEAAMETARRSKPIATNPAYQALAIAVDVTDISSVDSMVQNVVETFGRIDYNINSAGVGVQQHRAVDEVDSLEMNRFWQVNVMGTLNCIQAITKVMKTQSIATLGLRGRTREVGRGVILNVGSCNSHIATPQIVPYTTTKHALLGLTKTAGT